MLERILRGPNNQPQPARPNAAELSNVPELDKTVLDTWRVQVGLKVANREEQNSLAQKMRGLQLHEPVPDDKHYNAFHPMIDLPADPRESGYRISVGFLHLPPMTMHEALTHCLDATAELCGMPVDQIPLSSARMLSLTDTGLQKQQADSKPTGNTQGLPWQDVTLNALAMLSANPESTD